MALLCAPIMGYLSERSRQHNYPLQAGALVGIVAYALLGSLRSPEPRSSHGGSAWIWLIVAGIGVSQIGAIVCSLGLLGRAVVGDEPDDDGDECNEESAPEEDQNDEDGADAAQEGGEDTRLLGGRGEMAGRPSLANMKGSIAGVYSLSGGAGILLLTKLGGLLFDRAASGAPFFMLAAFNGTLLLACVGRDMASPFTRQKQDHVA